VQVLGTVKNAGLVIFCVLFLAEEVSSLQGTGYTIALAGFSWYQYIKTVNTLPASLRISLKNGFRDGSETVPLVDDDDDAKFGSKGSASTKSSASTLETLLTMEQFGTAKR
jgi:hypothetical protein